MPSPAPAHHSRAQRGKVHQIWRYTVHYSPVTPTLQFGVSKNGKVVHRARSLKHGIEWALDRTHEFYNRTSDVAHPLVKEAREVLVQYGRLADVAQA